MSQTRPNFSLVRSQLAGRPFREQLAFGICLLERSLPEYFQFQEETGWLGGGDLRAALAYAWIALEDPMALDEANVSWALQRCERWLPDSEEHANAYTSAAINAVDVACGVLEYMYSKNPQSIVEAAEARRDTVDLFVQHLLPQGLEGEALEDAIVHHPLMMKELQAMNGDLTDIEAFAATSTFATAVLQRVRALRYCDLRLVP